MSKPEVPKGWEPPLLVLTSAEALRGAAYGSDLRLQVEEVSPRLLAHALAHPVHVQPWLDSSAICRRIERPYWAPPGSLKGWCLYWLHNDRSSDAQRAAIPPH